MKDEIFDIMKKRQQTILKHIIEYRTLYKQIRNQWEQAKEEWLNENCVEIKSNEQNR